MLQLVDDCLMHPHRLLVGDACLTRWAPPICPGGGCPNFEAYCQKGCLLDFLCFRYRFLRLASMMLKLLRSLFLLSIFLLVASLAWPIIWIASGVTPTSSFANDSKSLRTSLVQPFGASHWSKITPRSHAELLSKNPLQEA